MEPNPPPPAQRRTCAIIGAGPAGLAAALALRKLTTIQPTIYEARPSPSTMGGAINVNNSLSLEHGASFQMGANALDLLRYLGINDGAIPGHKTDQMEVFSLRTGSKLGAFPFTAGPAGEPARRMLRADLQKVMLDRARQLAIEITYSSRVATVHESEIPDTPSVTLHFTDETQPQTTTDFVLGCDGVFSAVRRSHVEPDRQPTYMGSGAAYTVLPASKLSSKLASHSIVAGTSTRGWSLMSYCDATETQIFAAVVVPLDGDELPKDQKDWLIWREDKTKMLNEFRARFAGAKLACVRDLAALVDHLHLYVYPLIQLPAGGTWSKGRTLLLGDAAHAMPPQGEGTAFAIEDAVLLARIFAQYPQESIQNIFAAYEKTRRPRIDEAWKETNKRTDDAKPSSWVGQILFEWIIWIFLWFRGGGFGHRFAYDVRQEAIVFGPVA